MSELWDCSKWRREWSSKHITKSISES